MYMILLILESMRFFNTVSFCTTNKYTKLDKGDEEFCNSLLSVHWCHGSNGHGQHNESTAGMILLY